MKQSILWLPALACAIISSASCFGQDVVNTPRNSRQIQFLWEQSGTAFNGKAQVQLDSIFAVTSHRDKATALVLVNRTEPMPSHWTQLGEASHENEVNLLCSRAFLRPGENQFMIPADAIPEASAGGDWAFIFNGTEHPILPDEAITIEVPSSAESVTIGIRQVLGYDTLEHHLLLSVMGHANCPEPDLPPWPPTNSDDPFWVGVFDDGQPITGQALVRLSQDGVFDKPLLLLEGFDPGLGGHFPQYGFGDLNWDVIWNCDGAHSHALDGLALVMDSLRAEGFDLVFLDFENGTQSVFQQTALVRHVIEKCRDFRVGNSPLVLIGPSMGGVVGRLTLRQMELDDMDHCVRLFVAIDSPFRGAYLPVALQEAIGFFAAISVEAANLETALLTPAASELLIGSPLHPSSSRAALESAQAAMGFPEHCTNVAIANSHPGAASNPPVLWYSAQESFLSWEYLNIQLHAQPGNADHPASNGNESVIFEGELINTAWNWGEELMLDALAHHATDAPIYEGLAGSSSEHLQKFEQALSLAGIQASVFQPLSMFVPNHSALDIGLFAGFETENIPFDDWSLESLSSGAALHCDVTEHIPHLWNHIVLGQPAQSANNDTIQLGWSQPFKRTLQGSEEDGTTCSYLIGTQDTNGPGDWPTFHCATSTCGEVLRIAAGNFMTIGDPLGEGNSHAHFTVTKNERMEVQGDIYVGPHSALILEEGASLVLQSGSIHVAPFGQIIQKQNSRIECIGSGSIDLNGSTAMWTNSGVIHVHDNDTLRVTSEVSFDPGTIRFEDITGYVYLGMHANLHLSGQPQTPLHITFDAHARALTEGAGTMRVENANIDLLNDSEWQVTCKTMCKDVDALGISPNHKLRFEHRVKWDAGTWNNLNFEGANGGVAGVILQHITCAHSSLEFDSIGVNINDSEFIECAVNSAHLSSYSTIQSCSFSEGIFGHAQLSIDRTSHPVRLEGNAFEGHTVGLSLKESKGNMSCNTWHACEVGIALDTNAFLNASLPWGQNRWWNNGIHISCSEALLPDLSSGLNHMGQAADALLLGTVSYSDSLNESNSSTHTIHWNNNMWPNGTAGQAMMVPYIGLESTVDGLPVHAFDSHPDFTTCDSDSPIQQDASPTKGAIASPHDDQPFEWILFPNPADQHIYIECPAGLSFDDCKWDIFNMHGQRMSLEPTYTPGTNQWKISTHTWASGIYLVQCALPGQPAVRRSFIVQH